VTEVTKNNGADLLIELTAEIVAAYPTAETPANGQRSPDNSGHQPPIE
jgi:predicted transcriptional regulator